MQTNNITGLSRPLAKITIGKFYVFHSDIIIRCNKNVCFIQGKCNEKVNKWQYVQDYRNLPGSPNTSNEYYIVECQGGCTSFRLKLKVLFRLNGFRQNCSFDKMVFDEHDESDPSTKWFWAKWF